MRHALIVVVCLVLAGCIDRRDDALDALRGTVRECEASTVKCNADLGGPVRKFELTCEVKP